MRFSERNGHIQPRDRIQFQSMDDALRIGLWNVLQIHIWDRIRGSNEYFGGYHLNSGPNRELQILFKHLWVNFFKLPVDELSTDWRELHPFVKNKFYAFEWHQVYDFIEFIVSTFQSLNVKQTLIKEFNIVLARECSAYRFIDNRISNITDDTEIAAIEQALSNDDKLIEKHLSQSLEFLSSRSAPNYRNSMKEAMSALERCVVSQSPKENDYGLSLKLLIEKSTAHKAFQKSLSSIYGFTSDAEGIRHFLKEDSQVTFADAKFFLVLCSSFILWLQQKNSE